MELPPFSGFIDAVMAQRFLEETAKQLQAKLSATSAVSSPYPATVVLTGRFVDQTMADAVAQYFQDNMARFIDLAKLPSGSAIDLMLGSLTISRYDCSSHGGE